MVLVTSCTHAMHVKNLDQYSKTASAPRKLIIAIEDRSANPDEHEYFAFVQEALATHPDVRQVALTRWNEPAEVTPDVIVKVHPEPHYDGSGWNYLITFPGFLVFTHAWNGFVYHADIVTGIEVSLPESQAHSTQDVRTTYDMRHCDFARGALTSSAWYTPGWGGLNLIFGFFMIKYDTDATPEFHKEVRSAYGQYIANSIVEMASGALANPTPKATQEHACAHFDAEAHTFRRGCS